MNTPFAEPIEIPPVDELKLAQEAVSNATAFTQLYHQHVTRVYRYHMAHTGSVEDAEDLTSQTFIAVLQGLRSFRASGPIAAWIMGIASRKRLIHFRRNGNRNEIPLDEALHYPSPSLPTDKAAIRRLRLEAIVRALKQITADRA